MAEQKPELAVSRGRANYFFILLFLLAVADYIDTMVVTALFPFMKADLGVTDTQLALLVSAIFWSLVVFAVPIAYLLDRWSRTKGIGVFTVAWSIACSIIGFLRTFPAIFFTRCLMGIGESAYGAGGTALISAYYPEKERAKMNGIWTAAVPIGSVIGALVGGVVAEALGWRYAFGIVAIPAFIIGVLFFFTLRDYKTIDLTKTVADGLDAGKKVKMKVGDVVRDIYSKPSLLMNFLGFTGNLFVTMALITWLPTYFYRMMDKPDMQAATIQSSGIFLMAIIGAPVGGIMTDWIREKIKRARMLVPAITAIVAGALLFTAFMMPPGTPQYVVLIAMGFFAPWYNSGASAVTQDVVHQGLRSTSMGVANLIQNLLGASLGPIFVGAISDRFSLVTAFQLLPIFMLVGGVAFFIGSFFYLRDRDRVEKVELQLA